MRKSLALSAMVGLAACGGGGTLSSSNTGSGTLFTDTVSVSPAPGWCSVTVSDGILSNPTDFGAELDVVYTSSSIGVNAVGRRAAGRPPK